MNQITHGKRNSLEDLIDQPRKKPNIWNTIHLKKECKILGMKDFQRGATIAYAGLLAYAKMLKEEMEYYEQQERATYEVAPEEDMG